MGPLAEHCRNAMSSAKAGRRAIQGEATNCMSRVRVGPRPITPTADSADEQVHDTCSFILPALDAVRT